MCTLEHARDVYVAKNTPLDPIVPQMDRTTTKTNNVDGIVDT